MAAVAVGSGLFMQKFSLGDEEKIRTGKKLVKTALFSYVFILGIDLVLSAIQSLIQNGSEILENNTEITTNIISLGNGTKPE